MNLYLFNATDSAATYGIGTCLKELARALEGAGINIHVIHLHSVRPEFETVKTNRVENWYVPEAYGHNTFSGDIQKLEDYCRNVVYLLRLHIKDTKDLVFHFNYNQSQFLARELKAAFDCKTVATVHFMKWALELHGNLSRLHTLKKKPENQRTSFEELLYTTDEYESLLYKEADRIIALSRYTYNHLCSEYRINPDKISVIPNGLEDISPRMETGRDVLRKKWYVSKNEFVILFVGRLNAAKGLFFLIDAFRKALDKIPDCRLIIAGSGAIEPYLQVSRNICTKVSFTGLLEKKDLHELYQIADTGILPSLTEQCSYVIMEMMMHSLPIITTSVSGLSEMTENGISSLQVPVTVQPDRTVIDTDLLTEKILYLLEHPKEAKRLGNNARKRYVDIYSSEMFRKNMLNFYHSLFEKSKNHVQTVREKNCNHTTKVKTENNERIVEQLKHISDTLTVNAGFPDNFGLLNGKTGIALFFFHLARGTGIRAYEDFAGKLIDSICESLHQIKTVNYADGLAGFGAGISYLTGQRFIDADAYDLLKEIDNAIRRHTPYHLNSTLETGTGKTGLGKYYTERLANKTGLHENDPNQIHLSSIIRSLSCPYNTYRELLGVIDFLSGVAPLDVEPEKTFAYLNYAVDKMETTVYEDMHFGNYPGYFNPLIAATVLCRATTKTGNRIYSDKARQYLQQYEPEFRTYLNSDHKINTLKWSFLYGYLGQQFQNSELMQLSDEWLAVSLTKEFERNASMGLLDGYAGAGMYLLSLTGQCSDDWLDIVPCYIEKITPHIIMT